MLKELETQLGSKSNKISRKPWVVLFTQGGRRVWLSVLVKTLKDVAFCISRHPNG